MLNRNLYLALVLSVLAPAACAKTESHKAPAVEKQETIGDLERLIQTTALIVIAEVQATPPTQDSDSVLPDNETDTRIDFEKERDRAREATEETARSFGGLSVGPLIQLKTVETLKGPSTEALSIAASTTALENAKPGQLFLIFMGSDHPDAIRLVKSSSDPWVVQVKNALAD